MTNVPFRYLGTVDVSFFLKGIEELNWNTYTERQEKRFGMQDTYTIPLVWDINFKSRKRWADYSIMEEELLRIEKTLNKGEICSAVLTKLPAGKQINLHRDKGEFFDDTIRIHIPIVTNENCIFRVGRETRVMRVGEVWEICNHGKVHGTENKGDTDRIHLMLDLK